MNEELRTHMRIEMGYKKIYEGFDKLVTKYERRNDLDTAILYKKIANRFKDIHERYKANVEMMKGKII